MRIIQPTILQQRKLREMILKLFPDYGYVKIKNDGIIFLSKSFWHFILHIRVVTHISDMCTVTIPEKLHELYTVTFDDADTQASDYVINKYSHTVIELLHRRSKGVIDYLYDEFTDIRFGIQKTYYTNRKVLPEVSYTLAEILSKPKTDSIMLHRLSHAYACKAIKQLRDLPRIFNHPKLLSQFLNMWFNPEVKEKLKQYYKVRISVT
jgi:hypothetical protein